MIYSILDAAFTAATPAGFKYRSAPIWEANMKSFTLEDLPAVVFDADFVAIDNFIVAGKITTIAAHILFLQYHKFTADQSVRIPIIDVMHDAMNKFYQSLDDLAGVQPTIKRIEYIPIINFADANLCGISSRVTFEFMNSVC